MTLAEILEQAKALPRDERKQLADLLLDTLDDEQVVTGDALTGAEIVSHLEKSDPVEFVDDHIEDPVEWVKAQHEKRQDKLKPYWDGDA